MELFMDLESLKEFATERQCEIIDAVLKYGSQAFHRRRTEVVQD